MREILVEFLSSARGLESRWSTTGRRNDGPEAPPDHVERWSAMREHVGGLLAAYQVDGAALPVQPWLDID
jgi:hypothetical protein